MTNPEYHKAIAEKINNRIKELNLSQQTFAEMMDVNPSAVTKWLNGSHNFTVKTIFNIEWVLQMNIFNYNKA